MRECPFKTIYASWLKYVTEYPFKTVYISWLRYDTLHSNLCLTKDDFELQSSTAQFSCEKFLLVYVVASEMLN